MLRDLELLPVYDSAEHDLVQDLIIPLLSQSQEYWRGVSGSFPLVGSRVYAKGSSSLLEMEEGLAL